MNNRQERINEEIKREISLIIKELKDPRIPDVTSVTAAHVTKDMKNAKVYVSVMGDDEVQKAAIASITKAESFIRRELAGRIDMRHVPVLAFVADDSIKHGARISDIIERLGVKNEE